MVAVPSTSAGSSAAVPVHGEPAPAVIAVLAGRPSRDGFRATLLDLAARGWFGLRQPGVLIGADSMQLAGPVMCVLSTDADLTTLLPHERRAAARLVWHAKVSGEAAADAVMRDLTARELRAFWDEVRADAEARGLIARGRLTEGGREVLGAWRERGGEVPGFVRDVAYAAALGQAPLAPFAYRRESRRERVARWLRLPWRTEGEPEFDGQVLRQWEADRGSSEGIAHYAVIDDGVRTRTFRIASHVFETLTPGAVVRVQVDPKRRELLGVRPIEHRARAILPLCA
jgi:hypothetical protein